MKTYKIPVDWQVYGEMEIEAESLEKAIEIAENGFPYPSIDGAVDDSLEVDYDIAIEINGGEEIGSEPPMKIDHSPLCRCPECKKIETSEGLTCPECRGKMGQHFLSCSVMGGK